MIKFFSKKSKVKNEIISDDDQINFTDAKGDRMSLYVSESGNDTLLTITNEKSKSSVTLDKDKATVLFTVFAEFVKTGNITQCITHIKED